MEGPERGRGSRAIEKWKKKSWIRSLAPGPYNITRTNSRVQKKSYSLNGRAIKRGGGGNVAGPLREKELFLEPFFPTFQRSNGH